MLPRSIRSLPLSWQRAMASLSHATFPSPAASRFRHPLPPLSCHHARGLLTVMPRSHTRSNDGGGDGGRHAGTGEGADAGRGGVVTRATNGSAVVQREASALARLQGRRGHGARRWTKGDRVALGERDNREAQGKGTGESKGRREGDRKRWARGGTRTLEPGKAGNSAGGEGRGRGKVSRGKEKKAKGSEQGVKIRVELDMCSKRGDVMRAIELYDYAVKEGIRMGQHHYNVLLYLCSSAALGFVQPAKSGNTGSGISSIGLACKLDALSTESSKHLEEPNAPEGLVEDEDGLFPSQQRSNSIAVSDEIREYARTRGFEIFETMRLEKERIPMSEAALTAVARMAMSMGNGDMAFDVVKQMKELGIGPKLRSYGPALTTFCNSGHVEKAFEVEAHMLNSGVTPEEPELVMLLRASIVAQRGDRVYYLLHKFRATVRQVSPSTAELIQNWFRSSTASKVGKRKWDAGVIAKAIENNGGGWHGLGWLGRGKWTIAHTHVDKNGACLACGENLAIIDLDPKETEDFATSVAKIANKRERSSNFENFQEWLEKHGPFEAVVDAANVGLFNHRQLSLSKVNAVADAMQQRFPSKRPPLIVLHNKHLTGQRMKKPANYKLVEKWKKEYAIYATPTGSNDDWYWLYAAIRCKSLIITNDEMRDHTFQLLGKDFFPTWKERHQVHFTYDDSCVTFRLPPPCSVVIQESEKGHWHIPICEEVFLERERTWLCVTRRNPQLTRGSPTGSGTPY